MARQRATPCKRSSATSTERSSASRRLRRTLRARVFAVGIAASIGALACGSRVEKGPIPEDQFCGELAKATCASTESRCRAKSIPSTGDCIGAQTSACEFAWTTERSNSKRYDTELARQYIQMSARFVRRLRVDRYRAGKIAGALSLGRHKGRGRRHCVRSLRTRAQLPRPGRACSRGRCGRRFPSARGGVTGVGWGCAGCRESLFWAARHHRHHRLRPSSASRGDDCSGRHRQRGDRGCCREKPPSADAREASRGGRRARRRCRS